jgi:hypothetical protein
MSIEKQVWMWPWETKPPLNVAAGFNLTGGNVTVSIAYAEYPSAIMFLVHTKIANQEPVLWRRFWSPKMSAVEAAENLTCEAEDYLLETLGLRPRETEDLDFDDFIEHLRLRVNNEFN